MEIGWIVGQEIPTNLRRRYYQHNKVVHNFPEIIQPINDDYSNRGI